MQQTKSAEDTPRASAGNRRQFGSELQSVMGRLAANLGIGKFGLAWLDVEIGARNTSRAGVMVAACIVLATPTNIGICADSIAAGFASTTSYTRMPEPLPRMTSLTLSAVIGDTRTAGKPPFPYWSVARMRTSASAPDRYSPPETVPP